MTLPFDRKTFFDFARKAPFGNRLSQQQVEGVERILDVWDAEHLGSDPRWLAYILATAFHETGGKMVPVREGFATTDAGARHAVRGRRYARPDAVTGEVYYGRGDVQLTWAKNYRAMGSLLNLPLYEQPDLALDPEVSAKILVEGMLRGKSGRGDFTGKSLEDYFNATKDDPEGARRVINDTDKASLIAGYHHNFLDSIEEAQKVADKPCTSLVTGPPILKMPEPIVAKDVADSRPLHKDQTALGGLIAGLGGVAGLAGTLFNNISNPWAFAAFVVVAIGVALVLTGRVQIRYKAGV